MTIDNDTDSELSESFGASLGGPTPKFTHPDTESIVNGGLEILAKIPTGQHLLEIYHKYNIPVTVMSGREVTYNTPDEQSIILIVTPHYKKQPEMVATALGIAIRDIEQGIVGFKRPDKDLEPVEYAAMTFSKSLDIITYMCILVDELKTHLGFTKPLDKLIELGHGDIYKAYKANADYDTLVELFVEGERQAIEGK